MVVVAFAAALVLFEVDYRLFVAAVFAVDFFAAVRFVVAAVFFYLLSPGFLK